MFNELVDGRFVPETYFILEPISAGSRIITDYILLICSDKLAPSIECLAHLGSLLNTRGNLYYMLSRKNEGEIF